VNCGEFGHPMCTTRRPPWRKAQSSVGRADCYDAGGFYAESEVSGDGSQDDYEDRRKGSTKDHRGRGCRGGRGDGRGRGLRAGRGYGESSGNGQARSWAGGRGAGSREGHKQPKQEHSSERGNGSPSVEEDVQPRKKRRRKDAASQESQGVKSRRTSLEPVEPAEPAEPAPDLRSQLRAKLAHQQGRSGCHANGHASKVSDQLPAHLLQTSDLPLKTSLRERKAAARVSGFLR